MTEASTNLAREAVKSLRGFADLAAAAGEDRAHAASLFLMAAGAAAGLMIGREAAATAMLVVAQDLVETQMEDEAAAELSRDQPRQH